MSIHREFEQMLKQSEHLIDIVITHRTATAEIIAAFIQALIDAKQMDRKTALAVLQRLDSNTKRPSVDGSRSLIAIAVQDLLKQRT